MRRREHFYVKRNNAVVWLMCLCMLASATVRVADYSAVDTKGLWSACIVPVCASILYALIALVAGEEMLYKTAVPVWILGVCTAVRLCGDSLQLPACVVICAAVLLFCFVYTAVFSGRMKRWWLILCAAAALGGCAILTVTPESVHFLAYASEILFLSGVLVLMIAVRRHEDNGYHPCWGDRADGRLIRSSPVIEKLVPYIMVNRNGANNLFADSVEISAVEGYIRKKRREGLTGFGLTHVLFAAYARTVAKYPALNRFVSGQKIYSRGTDITICMTVKKEMKLESPDTVIKVHLNPTDTADDVYRKFSEQVSKAKDEMQTSGVDDTAGIMTAIPGLVLKFVVWLLKTMDYFGLVPGFLLEISPFHGSVYFTSMASLGIRPVFHHLYDFGNVPVFCAFGKKRRVSEMIDGEKVEKHYVDMNFTLDERICDGYYYASLIKYFMRLLAHPEVLDTPPETVEQDIP